MRFDVFYVLVNPGRTRSWDELLDEVRERAEMADELGFSGCWLGEHHFDAEGLDQVPNPIMLAADLAARTENIRFGIAAINLPIWHPVRLAEDLAMLDWFSKGRLDVAFSRGILPGEVLTFNPEADRTDEARSRAIFQEHLDIMKGCWTQDPFSWNSDRYQVPARNVKWDIPALAYCSGEDGYLNGLPVIPQPLQKPTPPLYAVTQKEGGFRTSVHQGLGVITSHPTRKVLEGLNAAYLDECEKIGSKPAAFNRSATLLRDTCVAETDEEARRLTDEVIQNRFDVIKRVRGLKEWLDVGEDPSDPKLQAMSGFDLMMERDYLLIGSPATVAKRIIDVHNRYGVDHLILSLGRLDQESSVQTLELMANEVIPAVRAELGDAIEIG
jgi:alkanesulfonate monooxygenase SsuD/methylene tetrahydromethanopterin reductase-like flavin-dependent oxidoreductase (luciferase family)